MTKTHGQSKMCAEQPLYPLDLVSDFFEAGLDLMRTKIRKRSPKMSSARIEKELQLWLTRLARTDTLRTDAMFQLREI